MTNRGFWQDKVGEAGAVRECPYPSEIEDTQLVIKAQAWALNPADHIVQDISLPFMTYPIILGEDVAGTVERVGAAAASHFKIGDRVIVVAIGVALKKSPQAAFQNYVVVEHFLACKIPDSVSFTDASVLPLCISTAAGALFAKEFLAMGFPSLKPVSKNQSVLIWGGSSSLGCNAIQLAKAAGYKVVTTCSARNFDLVKKLGADAAFDYSSASVVEDVVAELDQGSCVGIFNAAGDVGQSCQVSHLSKQALRVRSTTFVTEGSVPEGVDAKFLHTDDVAGLYREISPATFASFLPEALAAGKYIIAPEREIVPTRGIEGIQEALDILRKGVSAKKIVVQA